MKAFRKKYHPPGTAPGTLVDSIQSEKVTPLRIDVVNFDSDNIHYFNNIQVEQCEEHYNKRMMNWVHINGSVDFDTLKTLGDLFNLHPLAMEDVLNHGQRPKIEAYDQHLFIILNLPLLIDGKVTVEQVSLFCADGLLLSFHEQAIDNTYEMLHERLQKNTHRIRNQGSDHLLYVLIDLITDNGFPILEAFGERLESVEGLMAHHNDKTILQEIHTIKRELILLRRALWPQREVINSLLRNDYHYFKDENKLYLRDCYDHTIQIIELIESYRDMATSTMEVYLSISSNRLNEVMRFLTIISTLFIPPTFIVGVYGMNFQTSASPWNMPELSWPFGYLLVWLLMISIAMSLLIVFKRKRWL